MNNIRSYNTNVRLGGLILVLSTAYTNYAADQQTAGLTISWASDYLTISGPHLPSGKVRVHYLEAYCRDGSTDRAWEETVIGHDTKLVAAADDGHSLKLRCTLR